MKEHDWIDSFTLIITWLAPFIVVYLLLRAGGILGE